MKIAAVLVLAAAIAAPAFAQCDQCGPLDANHVFIFWGADSGCSVLSGNCQTDEPISFAVVAFDVGGSCFISTALWNFGDGTTSTEKAPTHAFVVGGTYDVNVTLTITDGCNPPRSLTIVAEVPVDFIGDACVPADATNTRMTWGGASVTGNPIRFSLDAATFGGFSCQTYTFQWDFGDGTTSTAFAPLHAYAAAGAYTVSVAIGTIDPGAQQPRSFTIGRQVTVAPAKLRRRSCCPR